MIYLASPYSDPSEAVRIERVRLTDAFVARHLQQGIALFSPILYGQLFEELIGSDAAAWEAIDEDFIGAASAMWVLCLPGWKQSKGVQLEIAKWEFVTGRLPEFKQT